MKHVFIIGSHTPYLTARGIIDYLKLNLDDVIFVLGRNYKCIEQIRIKTFDISNIYYIYVKNRKRNEIKKNINKIEQFISGSIKENYILYIPHLSFFTFQIFAGHEFCKDIKFIQEGIIDFCVPERHSIPPMRQILKNLYYFTYPYIWEAKGWNSYTRLNGKRVSETFSITDVLFKHIPCKHTIVKWPEIKTDLDIDFGGTFFVFESLVELKKIEREIYLDSIKYIVNLLDRKKINYIKFHPYQSSQNKDTIINYFKINGLKYSILPNEVPFEILLTSQSKLSIFGFTTSLLFYAELLGHITHNYTKLLCRSKLFLEYWKVFKEQLSVYGDRFKYETIDDL